MSVCIALSLFAGLSFETKAASTLSLAQLQAKFPDGKYWNHYGMSGNNADGWTNTPCPSHSSTATCNSFATDGAYNVGKQCFGFACKLGYDAYGSYPYKWARAYNLNNIKPGDIINYNGSNPGHTVFVFAVDGDTVTFAECNYGGRCIIKWGRSLKKSQFTNLLNVYVAPYALGGSGEHVHNYAEIGNEALHPHKVYAKCSCGDFYYTGDPAYRADCPECIGGGSCSCSTSYAGQYRCVTTSAPLTIRSGHGTGYSAIGSIPSGAEVTVTKADGSWAHVSYNGITGCASMSYLCPIIPYGMSGKYPLPFKCFPLSDSHYAADAYSAVEGTHLGYIYDDDFVTVKEIYDNGWCLVNTSWEGSTRDVYTWTAFFFNTYCPVTSVIIEAKAPTYIRYASTAELGWVDPGDKVYIVDNDYSDRKQIMYPHTDGVYRCGWIDASALVHTHSAGAAATCTSGQYCTVCDALLNEALGHSPGAAATCTTAQVCTRCGVTINGALGHSFGDSVYVESAHPHAFFKKCSRCENKQYTGDNSIEMGCSSCSFTIAYDANGGTDAPSAQTKMLGTALTLSTAEPTRTGYRFLGWSTDKMAVSPSYSAGGSYSADAGATLYAVWQANTYTVVYNANGGSGSTSSSSHTYGIAKALTANAFTRAGYSFLGWAASSNAASATYTDQQSVSNLTAEPDGTVTLYAVWATDTVTVTKVTVTPASKELTVGESCVLSAEVSPSDATNKAIVWSTDNPAAATVDGSGRVTAIGEGTAVITATAQDGSGKTGSCTITVLKAEEPQTGDVVFELGRTTGKAGETVRIDLTIASEVDIDTIGLNNLTYDTSYLSFTGFVDYGSVITDTNLSSVDNEKGAIMIMYASPSKIGGKICSLEFTIREEIEDVSSVISMKGLARKGSAEVAVSMRNGEIIVTSEILGDLNGDENVDVSDVVALLQYSIFPDMYPLTGYRGSVDFNRDGNIDVQDVVMLLQYSIFPDMYPLN